MRLTDLQIRKLKAPPSGQKTYFDDSLPGFGIRISQGGAKSYVVMFGRRRQLKTIGRYPDLGLADARRTAKQVQGNIELLSKPDSSSNAMEFAQAKTFFLEDCKVRTKASTRDEYRRLLDKYFRFDKGLHEVTRSDILKALDSLEPAPSERQHAFIGIRTLMNWCVRHGYLEASPVPPLIFRSQSRARILNDDEIKSVWIRAAAVGSPYGHIVRLLILTGQRRGEIAGLRHEWIEHDQIEFPTGFTKNKREHVIPIGDLTRGILDGLSTTDGLCFPARGTDVRPFSGWSKAKRAFDLPIDIDNYTLHDLRRTFSSTMARLGTPIHVTEKLLNHVSGTVSGVAAIYNRHSYMDEMREAIAAYDAHLVKLMNA